MKEFGGDNSFNEVWEWGNFFRTNQPRSFDGHCLSTWSGIPFFLVCSSSRHQVLVHVSEMDRKDHARTRLEILRATEWHHFPFLIRLYLGCWQLLFQWFYRFSGDACLFGPVGCLLFLGAFWMLCFLGLHGVLPKPFMQLKTCWILVCLRGNPRKALNTGIELSRLSRGTILVKDMEMSQGSGPRGIWTLNYQFWGIKQCKRMVNVGDSPLVVHC